MRRLWLLSLALLPLAGCSGGGDDDGKVTPPPTPTIGIQVAPASATVNRGANTTATITLSRGGNYTGAVTLTASSVPAGVTVTFNPSSLAGATTSATATIAVSNTAAAGAQPPIQITAAGTGVTSSSAGFTLTVTQPSIALINVPTTLSVVQGDRATTPITITRIGGYGGEVTVTATGLPAGVTAPPVVIGAAATTGTMTLTAGANAAVGTSGITLTASGTGVSPQTATVSLTVTAAATPSFSLTASPAAVSLAAGQSASSTVTLARSGGFTGAVTLAVTGAPAGMTATSAPASVASGATSSTLTIATTSAAAPGSYSLTITGSATGVANQTTIVAVTVTPAPGIAIATSTSTVSAAVGSNASTGVTLTRLGGYAGDVSLAATGLPAGVTATFAPATLSGTTTSSTLTLTVGSSVATANYPLVVRATGPATGGSVTAAANLTLTVTAAQGYTLSASAVTLQQAGSGTSTVAIVRSGGFAGAVNLSVSGLPNGVTASFNPAAATGSTSTLTFTATASATAGNFTATIKGTATGLADVITTVAGTVTLSGGGGGGIVNWTFCSADRFPIWFAVQNGDGDWSSLVASGTTNRVYTFSVGAKGGIAYAMKDESGRVDVSVFYMAGTEMPLAASQECEVSRATHTLTGTVKGLTGGGLLPPSAVISVGSASKSVNADGSFTIENAPVGLSDLLAVRSSIDMSSFSISPNKLILRRDVNYTSQIPELNFEGTEAFAPASAVYTISGLAGEQNVMATSTFSTANGSTGGFSSVNISGGSQMTIYGIPAAKTQAGDLHQVMAAATTMNGADISSMRVVYQVNQQLVNRTVSLGAQPPALSPSLITTAPYVRLGASGNWPADYGNAISIMYTQEGVDANTWTLTLSRGYSGTGNNSWTLTIPNFLEVQGFQTAWGLSTAGTTQFTGSFMGFTSGFNPITGQFAEGGSWRAAMRMGELGMSSLRR